MAMVIAITELFFLPVIGVQPNVSKFTSGKLHRGYLHRLTRPELDLSVYDAPVHQHLEL